MIKRYTLSCPSPDGFAVEPFDADLLKATVIVRGTDYDALAARLAKAERLLRESAPFASLRLCTEIVAFLSATDSAEPRETVAP